MVATAVGDDMLPTPALVVDRRLVAANIADMATRASAIGVGLRPHAKTHKSIAIGALQRAAGAVGLTVGTVREAEVFADAGFDDLLITAPPVGHWRLERLIKLAERAEVRVCVDSAIAVEMLNRACLRVRAEIGYVWEIDCGVGRFGTPPGAASAEEIARTALNSTYARFDGLLTFGGHVYGAASPKELSLVAQEEHAAIVDTADAVESRGVEVRIRSIGTTPTARVMEPIAGITELRPGNYVFYDATQVALGIVPFERCALSVVATVLARPSSKRVILDAGSKALAAERMSSRTSGFGVIRGRPELRIARLFEEQAVVEVSDTTDLHVGDRVQIIPNHACTTVNLHEEMIVVEGDEIVDTWPVDAHWWARHSGRRVDGSANATAGRSANG